MLSLWFFIDAALMLAGFYGISLAGKARLSGKLADIKKVLPARAHPNRCKDAKAALASLLPWLTLFSAVTILAGFVSMLQDLQVPLPGPLHGVVMVAFFAAGVLFLVMEQRAIRRYWQL